jgi:hypothetical protein
VYDTALEAGHAFNVGRAQLVAAGRLGPSSRKNPTDDLHPRLRSAVEAEVARHVQQHLSGAVAMEDDWEKDKGEVRTLAYCK